MGRSIKSLNNDRGGEYKAFDQFCKEMGIRHIYTMPYKPQQNGIAERRNMTLMDMMRSMMAYAGLQIVFFFGKLYQLQHISWTESRQSPNLWHLLKFGLETN